MKLLHIDAGITGDSSVSRQLSAAIVRGARQANPGLEVVRRDLDAEPISHLDSRNIAELQTDDAGVLQQFLDADVVVVGAPMYNLGIPSQLKAWFDRVLVAGKTFRYTAEGPQGLVRGKKVVIASARGGIFAPGTARAELDFHEPYLRALFRFMGIEDVAIVRAEGLAISPEHRQAALDAALASAPAAAAELALAA
jgi:FMN-dependent NADH-azoreductase